MNQPNEYTLAVCDITDHSVLLKDSWIIILHATKIPPHVGMIINGSYSSLTIKGAELNINCEALLKLISRKKIATIAIRLIKQPVFSINHQQEIFEFFVKEQNKVSVENTCLSPIKYFLHEFYALIYDKNELLFELIERLKQNDYIYDAVGFHLNLTSNTNLFSLPVYTRQKLAEMIKKEIS